MTQQHNENQSRYLADVPDRYSWATLSNGALHGKLCHLTELLRLLVNVSNIEHARGVPMVPLKAQQATTAEAIIVLHNR